MGIIIILFSFGLTAFICEGIFRVTYYSNLHSLVIFIVLGIAADDVFVFIDAWRQSKYIKEFDLKMRMSYSWKRAVRAMAVTSSTTSVAFLANSFSPIMPIKAFGIYAAIIIPANYLLVVFVFPPSVIFFERNLEHRCNINLCRTKVQNRDEIAPIQDFSKKKKDREYGIVEKFFGGPWNDNVKKFRFQIIVIFLIWTIFAIVKASKMGPLTKEEEFLPSDHPIMQSTVIITEKFPGGGATALNMVIHFGVKNIDKKGTSRWDAHDVGKAVFDINFDIYSKES
jgi:predicted RND superfamily exporter protein